MKDGVHSIIRSITLYYEPRKTSLTVSQYTVLTRGCYN